MSAFLQMFDQLIKPFGGQPWLAPVLGMIGIVLVFLIFFTTRDILLRTHSLLGQLLCILLVALLPGVGFLLYLIVRPARTILQRETDHMVRELHGHVFAVDELVIEEEVGESHHAEEDRAFEEMFEDEGEKDNSEKVEHHQQEKPETKKQNSKRKES